MAFPRPSHSLGYWLIFLAGCALTPPQSDVAPSPSTLVTSTTPQGSPTVPIPPSEPTPSLSPGASRADADSEITLLACDISLVQVNDPDAPLNVRDQPTLTGTVMGSLEQGAFVPVSDRVDGWFKTTEPPTGWIAESRTNFSCNRKTARLSDTALGQGITIADRFVGNGDHQYQFQGSPGQTLHLTLSQGDWPLVLDPQGNPLFDPTTIALTPGETWSQPLTQAGTYEISLSSQFRGYDYQINVSLANN